MPCSSIFASSSETIGLATTLMLALSWPLWIGAADFPKVPFASWVPQGSRQDSTILFAALLVAIFVGAFSQSLRRLAQLVSAGILGVLLVQDQHRFQPWIYLFLAATLLDAFLTRADFVRASRLWYIGIYIHSGLSKLDAGFRDEIGTLLLNTALRPLGIDSRAWTIETRTLVILAFPLLEIVMGMLLFFPFTRRLGVIAARLFHLSLIILLGPLGLKHSTILLIWNLAMILQVGLVFSPAASVVEKRLPSRFHIEISQVVTILLLIGLLAPLTERFGWYDAWTSHALYASHPEKMVVYLHEDEAEHYPEVVRRHLQPGETWRALDLTGWSREVRGTPVYPQNRANLGLAEALATLGGQNRLVKVVEWSAADRRTNARALVEYTGVEMIRLRGRRFFLNAAPYTRHD